MITPTFINIYGELTKSEKDLLDDRFIEWSNKLDWDDEKFKVTNSKIVIENLKKDHFLAPENLRKIIRIVIDSKLLNIEEILINVRQSIWHSHQLCGDKIKCSHPQRVGTVMSKKDVVNFLMTNYGGQFKSERHVETFLGKKNDIYKAKEREYLLKNPNYLVWVTWNELSSEKHPFAYSKNLDRNEIIRCLGLKDDLALETILLFTINSFEITDIFRPTIADANIDNDFFRPTLTEVAYGLTNPTSPIKLISGHSAERPEGLIKSINLNFSKIVKQPEHA